MLKVVTILLSLCFIQTASAFESEFNRKITAIAVYKDYATIRVSPEFTNKDGCTSTASKVLLKLTFDSDGSKQMLSMAQALYLSKSNKAGFKTDGCSNTGAKTFPNIVRIDGR